MKHTKPSFKNVTVLVLFNDVIGLSVCHQVVTENLCKSTENLFGNGNASTPADQFLVPLTPKLKPLLSHPKL